jgi:regulator of nucleoside diphosphate kinase
MTREYLFTDADRCRLGGLLISDDARAAASWQVLDELQWLLETSKAVQPETIPHDVVTMNSTVRLINGDSVDEIICTVVYPEDLDLIEDGISVLAPLGTLLIGCEVDDLVECEDGKHRGTWRVAEIVFQPERVGKFQL